MLNCLVNSPDGTRITKDQNISGAPNTSVVWFYKTMSNLYSLGQFFHYCNLRFIDCVCSTYTINLSLQ